MTGQYLTGMADVLRAAGVSVIEVEGWQTRARSSGGYSEGRPFAIMWHHTASAPGTSADNNVGYIINGSPDAPIANIYLHNNGVWYVCAAGCTNTNGKGRARTFSKGTVPADSMNTYALGIEAGNSGVGEPWPQVMIDSYFKGSNTLAAAYGLLPTDIDSHQDYAPDRKIDPATASAVQGPWQPRSINSSGTWNVDDMKAEAQRRAAPTPLPPVPTPGDEVVEVVIIKVNGANAAFIGYRVKQTTTAADGTHERMLVLWMEWVDGTDPLQMQRYNNYVNIGCPEQVLNLPDLTGIGLIGPIPSGDGLKQWSRSDFGNVL